MLKKNKTLLVDTCGWIASLSVIVFFFTLWLYSYNDIQDPLKESWSITFNSISAFATIGAAIIAANLFNDWKEQHNKTILAPEAIEIYKAINADIMINAEYMHLVKLKINQNLQGDVAIEIFREFGKFIETRGERVVTLKYFSTIAQNEKINELIKEYSELVNFHLYYFQSLLPTHAIIDQTFIDENYKFIQQLTSIQLEINKNLSDYILVN